MKISRKRMAKEVMMRTAVDRVDTFGGTAFYDALLEGFQMLQKNEEAKKLSRWVIGLTDGEDQHRYIRRPNLCAPRTPRIDVASV